MDEVTFTVDEIQSGSDIIEGHMDASCFIEFDGPIMNVCQVSLEAALRDYDKFIYTCHMIDHFYDVDHKSKAAGFMPGFNTYLADHKMVMKQF